MPNIRDAVVGQWYLRQDTGEMFWVTDYDDESGTVEIQTLDGDLDELDEEVWQSLPLAWWSLSLRAICVADSRCHLIKLYEWKG